MARGTPHAMARSAMRARRVLVASFSSALFPALVVLRPLGIIFASPRLSAPARRSASRAPRAPRVRRACEAIVMCADLADLADECMTKKPDVNAAKCAIAGDTGALCKAWE